MIKQSQPKPKKCKVCPTMFVPRDMREQWCSFDCAVVLGLKKTAKIKDKAAKAERVKDKASLLALKPRKWWLAKAKDALHAYIRARDEGKSCISCDTPLLRLGRVGGDYDAGHFLAVGSHKHLEMVEANIFGQCKHCNEHLNGNQNAYRARLVANFGQEYVDALESDQTSRKLTIADFQAIEAEYKAKLKQLRESACS